MSKLYCQARRLERIRTAVKAFAELYLSSRPRDFMTLTLPVQQIADKTK